MIFRRVLFAVMALSAFGAGAGVIVVALAFALYALLEPHLGRAGAAAVMAAGLAFTMMLAGLAVSSVGRKRPLKAAPLPLGLLERVIAFVQEKPIVAASAAIGAGFMAVRNPKYLGEVLRAFFEGKSAKS